MSPESGSDDYFDQKLKMSRKDSVLFTPVSIGHHKIMNRFMRSATNEYKATSQGIPKDELKNMMINLSRCQVGLIVPGCMYITSHGRRGTNQCGMCTSAQSRAWKNVIDEMHKSGSKVLFQIMHAGTAANPETMCGSPFFAPSAISKNSVALTKAQIEDIIHLFRSSAELAYKAGADGVQLHCAHGYLLSQFLSPYYNRRTDEYGGDRDNRLRIVAEIIQEIRQSLPSDFIVSMKMNGDDYIDGGLTPKDASYYVSRLTGAVDLFEISGGATGMKSMRYRLEEKYLLKGAKKEEHQALIEKARSFAKGNEFTMEWNVPAAKIIRKDNPKVKLAVVGGLRNFYSMEKLVNEKVVDICSISRPFIKDPAIVMRYKVGTIDVPNCWNCNDCFFNIPKKTGIFCHIPTY